MDVVDTLSVWGRICVLLGVATFVCAVATFVSTVVLTNAVYGTRLAWFLGVVVPLLVMAAGLSWLASRRQKDEEAVASHVPSVRRSRIAATGVLRVCLLALAIPVALVAAILLVYGILFVPHSL